jgi:PAS domain S-box-containing protein
LRAAQAHAAAEPDGERAALLHDLEVHQLELEMQNRELRAAQLQVEESRARLADLYDFAPVVYVTLNAETRIIDANLTAATYFGVERGKLTGRALTAFASMSDREALRQHVQRCFAERIRVESELSFSMRGRSTVTAQMVSVPLFDADGAVIGCKTTLTDITALKRAQERLQFLSQASAILASSFDYRTNLAKVVQAAVPVLADVCILDLVDDAGQVSRLEMAFADHAAAVRLDAFRTSSPRAGEGTALGRVIHTRQPLLFPECSPTSLAEGFEHDLLIKASGAQSMMLVPLVVRDRAVGVLTMIAVESGPHYSGSSLSTAHELATHAALAIDNARLYERAQGAIRAREDVLSFVSHDLRNPLMGILLTTETLLNAVHGEERRKGWKQLERIRRGVQQMRHMIDDLLDVASLDSGRLTVKPGEHDVRKVFDDIALTLAPLAAEKRIALRFDVPPEALLAHCDRDRVIQVLSNLIGNSIKFTPDGGSVVVAASGSGTNALLTVSDSGPGIPSTLRPHIFERFWQAEETARKGRGLGLYIAKGLVEAQGGAIWVDSSRDEGTTFSFTLPLSPPPEPAEVVDRPSPGRPHAVTSGPPAPRRGKRAVSGRGLSLVSSWIGGRRRRWWRRNRGRL